MEMIKIVLTELLLFAPVLLVVVSIRAILKRRARMKQTVGASISVLVIMGVSASPAFSQDKQRIIRWRDPIPAGVIPGTPALWQETIDAFRKDLEQMQALVEDPATDLHAKILHGDGQTILREALLVADHNAYHLGVLTVMSRIVKSNPGK